MAEIREDSLRVDVNRFHFIWKLAGFNKIPFISRHYIRSPSFSLNDNSETLWQLAMAKEIRCKVEPKNDILIFESTGDMKTIAATNDAKPEKAVGFTMMKSDLEGQTWEVVKYNVQIKVGDATFETKEKIENGESYYEAEGFDYIFSSDLNGINLFDEEILTIEAFIEHKQVDPRPLDSTITRSMVHREKFSENLMSLLKRQKYTDIILKAGDCEIAAHKCILSARTWGLEHHFPSDDSESTNVQTLDLDFDDESVAEAFLIHAYCGSTPVDFPDEKEESLSRAAAKYEAEDFKTRIHKNYLESVYVMEKCVEILMKTCTPQEALAEIDSLHAKIMKPQILE